MSALQHKSMVKPWINQGTYMTIKQSKEKPKIGKDHSLYAHQI